MEPLSFHHKEKIGKGEIKEKKPYKETQQLPVGCEAELCNRRERRELWVGTAVVGVEPEGSMAPMS